MNGSTEAGSKDQLKSRCLFSQKGTSIGTTEVRGGKALSPQADVGDSGEAVKILIPSSPPSRTTRTLFGNKRKLPAELGSYSSEAFVDAHRGLQNSP